MGGLAMEDADQSLSRCWQAGGTGTQPQSYAIPPTAKFIHDIHAAPAAAVASGWKMV